MAKNTMLKLVQQITAQNLSLAGLVSRMQTLDKVTITLGRMGMSPDWLAEFEDEFRKTEVDYCDDVINDNIIVNGKVKHDKDMWKSKADIDRELEQYVRPDRFAPYDKRYKLQK